MTRNALDYILILSVFWTITFGIAFIFRLGMAAQRQNGGTSGQQAVETPLAGRNTAPNQPAASGGVLVEMVVFAYCQEKCCCGIFADGITASGYRIQPGDKFVAAPPDIPFGTRLSIPGYNDGLPVTVRDRGGLIMGRKIDVFFDDKDGITGHQRALNWGRQKLKIKILNILRREQENVTCKKRLQ